MDVEAGVPPMKAIQSATINVAKTFKKDKDYGSVEPGKVADLSIIEGDPLADIWMTQNVKMVIMDGKVMDIGFHGYKNPIPCFYSHMSLPMGLDLVSRQNPRGIRADGSARERPWNLAFPSRVVERRRATHPLCRQNDARGDHSAQCRRRGGHLYRDGQGARRTRSRIPSCASDRDLLGLHCDRHPPLFAFQCGDCRDQWNILLAKETSR